MYIQEIFGPTIQGEGPFVGVPTIFIRVAGCSFRCKWCDTPKAVLPENKNEWEGYTAKELIDEVQKLTSSTDVMLTFTGGNPAIYDMSDAIVEARKRGFERFAVETQGDIFRTWFIEMDSVVLSPKPPSSGVIYTEEHWNLLDKIIRHLSVDCVTVKIVVSDESDLDFAEKVFKKYPNVTKFITPCNTLSTVEDSSKNIRDNLLKKTEEVIDMVMSRRMYDVHVVPQLHVLLWGNKEKV